MLHFDYRINSGFNFFLSKIMKHVRIDKVLEIFDWYCCFNYA